MLAVITYCMNKDFAVIDLAARYDYSLKVYIMERKELNELTNDVGVRYLDYVYDWEIIGVEEDYDGTGYLYPIAIIKGWPNENERFLGVIYISKKYAGNGAGFFSRFEYFCRIVSCRASGINPKYDHKGDIIWPAWYCTNEEYGVFVKKYNELHEKYDKYVKSDCA